MALSCQTRQHILSTPQLSGHPPRRHQIFTQADLWSRTLTLHPQFPNAFSLFPTRSNSQLQPCSIIHVLKRGGGSLPALKLSVLVSFAYRHRFPLPNISLPWLIIAKVMPCFVELLNARDGKFYWFKNPLTL